MTRPPYRVSGAKRLLDMEWVINALQQSYWGAWLKQDAIKIAVNNSLTFGAYEKKKGAQIGFCRVITDRAVISSITDMIVAPHWMGQGVGSSLMREALANPWVAPTLCILASRDHREWYKRFGFEEVKDGVMRRNPA